MHSIIIAANNWVWANLYQNVISNKAQSCEIFTVTWRGKLYLHKYKINWEKKSKIGLKFCQINFYLKGIKKIFSKTTPWNPKTNILGVNPPSHLGFFCPTNSSKLLRKEMFVPNLRSESCHGGNLKSSIFPMEIRYINYKTCVKKKFTEIF